MLSMVILLMGVSGSGKTTLGAALARRLHVPFYDGDAFHPPENVEKMRRGEPLEDADRLPWLEKLRQLVEDLLRENRRAVVACSALKRSYRDLLRRGNPGLVLVYLKGDYALIRARLQERRGHYMPPGLLQSQFDALEEPDESEALTVDIQGGVDEVAEVILKALSR